MSARSDELAEPRGLCLFGLKEQRIVLVPAEHQHDPCPRADAAHADHLDRRGRDRSPEKVATVKLEAAAVAADEGAEPVHDLVLFHPADELLDGLDEGRVADDAALAVDDVCELVERLQCLVSGPSPGSLRPALGAPIELRRSARATPRRPTACTRHPDSSSRRIDASRIDRHRQRSTPRPFDPSPSIRCRVRRSRSCREPLHVPLPRARQRLVEVIDVEHQPAIGRPEHSEVHEVRIAAQLRCEP